MYDDIINMKYPNDEIDADFPDEVLRSAQFAPFAALTGHDEAIAETARLVSSKRELDECRKQEIDRQLASISNELGKYSVTITYFLPDKRKSGGEYVTACDFVKKIDVYEKKVVLAGGVSVPVDDIFKIEI